MSAPQPTAAGTLAATPIQHLLVYALDRRLTGSIVLETPRGERSALLLQDGIPCKAKTHEPVIHLGRLLVEMGVIDDETANRTLARVAKERCLHGKLLLDEHLIDRKRLMEALREQLARKILWMATLPADTMYGYYEGKNFLERWGGEPTPLEPLALVWRAIKSYETAPRIEATLGRLPARELRLHSEAQPGRFRFAARDAVVIDVLRAKPQTLRDLCESEAADEASIKRVVYALAVTRHLDLGGAAKPIGISTAPIAREPDAKRTTSRRNRRRTTGGRSAATGAGIEAPEVAALRRELVERAKLIPQENYYEILGIARDATTTQIQTAFFQLAKKWHPDRLAPELKDVRELVIRTFARMSEAHQVLADEGRREEYDKLLEQGGGTSEEQEEVQAVMRAITSFRKAEVLLKKRSLAEAEELAKRALEDDPSQADYHALYAWILSQKPERANGPYDDLIEMLDSAVEREPTNERARFYRAQLLKRAGRADAAIKDFRAILTQNPKHLDALREIRLFDMRKSQAPTAKPSKVPQKAQGGGLLNKLFKR